MSRLIPQNESISLRNNRILRRAIIPKNYHNAAKLMARSLEIPVGEIYDQAVSQFLASTPHAGDFMRVGRKNNPPKVSFWLDAGLSQSAKTLAESLELTEHEVLLTAIFAFAKQHNFDKITPSKT